MQRATIAYVSCFLGVEKVFTIACVSTYPFRNAPRNSTVSAITPPLVGA